MRRVVAPRFGTQHPRWKAARRRHAFTAWPLAPRRRTSYRRPRDPREPPAPDRDRLRASRTAPTRPRPDPPRPARRTHLHTMSPKSLHTGDELHAVIERLYPIMRSITGQGVRDSLAILAESIDLQVHAVASGTPVLDWSVPDEWVFHEAWVEDAAGKRVLDTADSTLPRRELQHRLRRHGEPERAARPHPHPARAARRDSVPHQLLPPRLGAVPASSADRDPGRGPVPGARRRHPPTRRAELRRVRDSRHQRPARSWSPPTSATRVSPTTTSRAWCWRRPGPRR